MAALGDLLQQVYEERGRLTPAVLVEEAEPEAHPLHHRFEWDDGEAARRYRLVQAGRLIRSVRIVYGEKPDGTPERVRQFVSVAPSRENPAEPDDDEEPSRTYLPVKVAMASEVTAQQVLRDFETAARALRRQYGHLREFAEVVHRELLDATV